MASPATLDLGVVVLCETRTIIHNDKIYSSPSGAIAQLGERIVRNDEVVGSIPTSSTNLSLPIRALHSKDSGFRSLP